MAVSIHFTGKPKPKCIPLVIRSAIFQLRSLRGLTEQQVVIHFSAQTFLYFGENQEKQKDNTHVDQNTCSDFCYCTKSKIDNKQFLASCPGKCDLLLYIQTCYVSRHFLRTLMLSLQSSPPSAS